MLPQPSRHRDALTPLRPLGWGAVRLHADLDPAGSAALPVTETPAVAGLVPAGEVVVLSLRPSLWYVVLARLEWLGLIGVLTIVGVWVVMKGWIDVPVLTVVSAGAAGAALVMLWLAADWLTRLYLLTDRRVVRVSGVLRQFTFDVPLEHVQSLALQRRVRERVLGLGTPVFASAGVGIGEFSWDYVAQPLGVMRLVREALERYRRTPGTSAGGGGL